MTTHADLSPAAPGAAVLLAGGVGGARLARGLQAHLDGRLTVIVNTADDIEQHGLLVSPDHDTVMYTLAGIDNREWGWGIAGETFAAAGMLERYGEPSWFRLGDRDLATHIVRTARLRRGDRPTDIALDLQRALGVRAVILPMTDSSVRTQVRTDDGWLEFQDYFVRLHQAPDVREVRFDGLAGAAATPEVEAALAAAAAILIAPSNPFVSVQPVLGVAGIESGLQAARARGARVVAVSGIVMVLRLEQMTNASSPMLLRPLTIVTLVRLMHCSKAAKRMLVTLLGIVTLVRRAQVRNAKSQMVLTVFGMI